MPSVVRYKHWREEDEELVVAKYLTMPAKVLARLLNRTPYALYTKARDLGLNKRPDMRRRKPSVKN